jgi:hypothetical protein
MRNASRGHRKQNVMPDFLGVCDILRQTDEKMDDATMFFNFRNPFQLHCLDVQLQISFPFIKEESCETRCNVTAMCGWPVGCGKEEKGMTRRNYGGKIHFFKDSNELTF